MHAYLRALALLALVLITDSANPRDAPLRIALVGDSTVAERGGWGSCLRAALLPDVEVINDARNGRSSKISRDEGAWVPMLEAKPRYIVIQFGHNDCPGKGPKWEADPTTTYRDNLRRYINEAPAAGAQPILATSIVRCNFTPVGHIKPDCLVPFFEQVRTLAAETGVPLLELHEVTRRQAESLGPAASDQLGPLTTDGKPDRTNLSPKGQAAVRTLVSQELIRVCSAS